GVRGLREAEREDAGKAAKAIRRWQPIACVGRGLLELGDELPGQGGNESLQAIFPDRGPVIDARRGVRAVERAHLDRVTGHTPFEVVANVFLATDRRRREACGNRTTVDLGVLHDAALPTAGGVAPLARAI